ncbi:hypothetical protein [Cellulosimicrobium cellulans]|uniref:hypothetical protein n=1 Tax=Cellulosimicrobium cellulans TaxID=1710 RepID=UPI001BA59051|nr:hypothetical protein [Cellulosimicrobium cellulans]QUC01106.1 hypothetical protein J5A69_08030 [Cellulosimicrobium cellulans]
MSALRVAGTLLTANADDRILTYRLLPYGEPGRTSAGTVTASKGTLTIPDDVSQLVANVAHDRERPAARFVSVTDSDDGLDVAVRAFATRAGDDLLAEATEGARTGISVEIDAPVIRSGNLLGGVLSGAGFTTTPAFPSAQLVACDCGDTETTEETDSPAEAATAAEKEGTMPENTAVVTDPAPAPLTAAAAPFGLPTGTGVARVETLDDVAQLMASGYARGDLIQRLTAAQGDITTSSTEDAQAPVWLGEVWTKRSHRQRFVPLFTSQPLTGLKAVGWRFKYDTANGRDMVPEVADYAGFPAAPATFDVEAEAVEVAAKRFAGTNKVDRANFDFSNPAFWAGYYREQANSVSRKEDAAALAHMLTAANYVAVTGTEVPNTVSNAYATLSAVVDGIIAIQDRSVPDYALIPLSAWRELLLLPRDEAFAYLSISLGLDPEDGSMNGFQFIPTSNATIETAAGAKKVLVGSKEAHTHYGEKTVRAETVNIGDGSVSVGLFGYDAFLTGDPRSHALVTLNVAA